MFNSVFNPEVVFSGSSTSDDKLSAARKRYWTKEREELLKKELLTASDARLAVLFPGKTLNALTTKGHKLGVRRQASLERVAERMRRDTLTPEQEQCIIANPQMSAAALSNKLNVFVRRITLLRQTRASVRIHSIADKPPAVAQSKIAGIGVDKRVAPRTHARKDPWTCTEKLFLIENVYKKSTNDIAVILDRSPEQIRTKARSMSLYSLPFSHPNPNRYEQRI